MHSNKRLASIAAISSTITGSTRAAAAAAAARARPALCAPPRARARAATARDAMRYAIDATHSSYSNAINLTPGEYPRTG
eukprot:COSAG01_NODE_3963_length_5491_cov_83.216617_9_plen_80_part_00